MEPIAMIIHKMKKYFLVCGALLFCFGMSAQKENDVRISLGAGIGAYTNNLKWSYHGDITSLSLKRKGESPGFYIPIEARFHYSKWGSVGGGYSYGTYKYEDVGLSKNENRLHTMMASWEFTMFRATGLQLYGGPTFLYKWLAWNELDNFYTLYETPYKMSSRWKGAGFCARLGILASFNHYLGMDINVRFERTVLNLTQVKYANDIQDPRNYEATLGITGFSLGMALFARINSQKEEATPTER